MHLVTNIDLSMKQGNEIEYAQKLKGVYHEKLKYINKLEDVKGRELCRMLTQTVHSLIQTVYKEVLKIIPIDKGLTIIALGSYGRGELNPHSDIDLLFLHQNEENREAKDFISKVLYTLWDMKITLGHSSRTLKNVISMASKDITFKTSLIDHHLICGDSNLYESFQETVSKIFKKNRYNYYQDLLSKLDYFSQTLGENVLLKEPNIKESLGALRGVHLIRWLNYNFFQGRTLSTLYDHNIMDKITLDRMEDHLDYLLSVRHQLHTLVGHKEEYLLLEHQERLAQHVHLPESQDESSDDNQIRLKIEHYMRQFYRCAKDVYKIVVQSVDLYHLEADKYRQFVRLRKRRKSVSDQFMIINGKLFFKNKLDTIDFSPSLIMEIFLTLSRYGCHLGIEIENYIKSRLDRVDDAFHIDPIAFSHFKSILSGERNLYHTLSVMNHIGFLPSYLPFFNELDCTVQHDYYHAYTVDEHTLQGIKEIEKLYHTDDTGYAFFKHLLQQLDGEQRLVLMFSIFFHDIGKGRPGSHVKNGETMIDTVVNAFPMEESQKETLTYLVNGHLIMAHTSQRRNIQDIKVIYHFVNDIKTKERLDLMLLLTYGDMSSVAPKVFTFWKGELLRELYNKSLHLLNDTGMLPVIQQSDLKLIQSDILEALPKNEQTFAHSFFSGIDPRYLIDHDLEEIKSTIEIFQRLEDKQVIDYEKSLDFYKLKYYAKDAYGVFAQVSLVLAMNGISIHSAKLYSKPGGYVIDTFTVSSVFSGDISEDRWESIKKDSQQVREKGIEASETLLEERRKHFPPVKGGVVIPESKVLMNNDLSDQFTVIEIKTWDQIGVLYQISRILTLHKVRIK
ncbi:MAG TPA: hypothetical protein ENI73_10790 [Spirochaetes bacterium]|nr:hypothetical protein [Spirochaetota bacterium]